MSLATETIGLAGEYAVAAELWNTHICLVFPSC